MGVVKKALRKTIGRQLLNETQFFTILKEIEAVVNSRPLVYVGEDINSNVILTPNSFLCLNPNMIMPKLFDKDENYSPQESSAEKLLKFWQKGQKLLDNFWRIWRDEYLLSLRERSQTHIKTGRIHSDVIPRKGQIVILKDETPRANWRLGRITELVKSSDGLIRSAKVKTPSGRVLGRPLNLLFPLETSEEYDEQTESKYVKEPTYKRPLRKAAVQTNEKIRQCLRDS